ncbi:MmcQ/YjbR family DNA-binding protein [Aliiglaciecola sp. 3_MG-2023]|uniref:MmcQ/YjbR family DNA-binding protein n=1 Tax=Aliiglaciecola sp. 3_MG-2023 TaxID=3062644 RepID=UPI0026E476C2|nr:MmcQ/YjbR family DNA-binding protein [Aliiglaciecola sp. 3_MG-2023]MDO6694428.1 MmcQ/YjbR family DNA-binding protein [Aliiglaciecola sp. 3_MG-2023]
MNYQEFNQFCGALLATTYVMQWGNSHVWKVGGKVFAIGGWSKDKQPAFTFKTSEQNYHFLCERPGYIPAPYFASRGMKWIQQVDSQGRNNEELEYYLKASYGLVIQGLSKAKQKSLGLQQSVGN